MKSVFPLSALAAILSLVSACGRPPTILSQARPNPFPGHRGYVLAPMQFDGLVVGDLPAQMWLAERTPEQQNSFNVDLAAVSNRFAEAVVGTCGVSLGVQIASDGTPPGSFVIRPTLIRVDPSSWSEPDHRLTVRIFAGQGAPLDVVLFHANGAGVGGYALGTRMRFAAAHFGRQVCDYLRERSNG